MAEWLWPVLFIAAYGPVRPIGESCRPMDCRSSILPLDPASTISDRSFPLLSAPTPFVPGGVLHFRDLPMSLCYKASIRNAYEALEPVS